MSASLAGIGHGFDVRAMSPLPSKATKSRTSWHFGFGSQAEVTALIFDVCFTPNIRHLFDRSARPLRANKRHGSSLKRSPVLPQYQTSFDAAGTSASCQFQKWHQVIGTAERAQVQCHPVITSHVPDWTVPMRFEQLISTPQSEGRRGGYVSTFRAVQPRLFIVRRSGGSGGPGRRMPSRERA